jgi:hypothetical protein
MRSVVDFPAPFGPRKPVTRPGSAVKVTSSTAVKAPYFLVRDSTSIMLLSLVPDRPADIRDAAQSHPGLERLALSGLP